MPNRINGRFVSDWEWFAHLLKRRGKCDLDEILALLIQAQRDRQAEIYRWMASDLAGGSDLREPQWYEKALASAKRRQGIVERALKEVQGDARSEG